MNMEKLIEEVKKYPALYDQATEQYRNAEYKHRVWKKIANELQVKGGGEVCKKKWASIRDQFRRTLQKRKAASGQAAHRKYRHESTLQFLLPHLAEISNTSSIKHSDSEVEADIEETVEKEAMEISEFEQSNKELEASQMKNQRKVVTANTPVKSGIGLKRKLRQELKSQKPASSQLMTLTLTEKETEKQSMGVATKKTENDPVDAFLAGIAPTLKSLNPILLNQAKSRIFFLVQDYELKQLRGFQESIVHQLPSESLFSPSSGASPYEHNTSDRHKHCELDNVLQISKNHTSNQKQCPLTISDLQNQIDDLPV